jgi:hypothetical protein
MRCSRVLGAAASVSSLVMMASVFSPSGCANSDGDGLVFGGPPDGGDSGHDAPGVTPHNDATTHPDGGHDSGLDSTVKADNFVPPTDTGVDSGEDAFEEAGFDAGGFDAGAVFFGNPGTACSQIGAVQAQQCGKCGTQTSMCIARPDGGVPFDAGVTPTVDAGHDAAITGDASATTDASHDGSKDGAPEATVAPHDSGVDSGPPPFVWGEFGACTGEIANACLPGTTTVQSCGTCGTQTIVCEPDCQLGATNCVGQVVGGCTPGSIQFVADPACQDAGFAGTQTVCSATCSWDAGATCANPPSALVAPAALGGVVQTFVSFTTALEDPLVATGDCHTTLTPSDLTPYQIITVQNPSTTQTVTISVWTSQAAGQPQLDVAITAYTQAPSSMASLKNCEGDVNDSCFDNSDPTMCLGSYGGLTAGDFDPVTIPAGGTVWIFVQDQFSDAPDLGTAEVTVRTESFQ